MNTTNNKYISIDVITSRILKHPLLKDLNYEDIISYTVDVLRLVNMPRSYVEKSCYLNIVDYKAKLPNDNLNIKTVDYIQGGYPNPMTIATDSLHNHMDKLTNKARNTSVLTYTIDYEMIKTNQESGVLFITYNTLQCDKDGLPMIPDNVALIKAIENYIKVQVFSVLVDLQKINRESLNRAEQEYCWYIGKAQTSYQGFLNEDDMESFLNDFKRLFIQNNTHGQRHMYNVNKELRYKN